MPAYQRGTFIFSEMVPIKSLKPALSLQEQMELLISRGMRIENTASAQEALARISYYRLRAYWIGLADDDDFHGITFEHIFHLYLFDERLRHLIMRAIEPIEIELRTRVARFIALKYGEEGHLQPEHYSCKEHHRSFLSELLRNITKPKNSLVIQKHDSDYGGHYPVWVAFEFVTFGQLSRFYNNLTQKDQEELAREWIGEPNFTYFRSWIRTLVSVRNISAHYGRLYNLPIHERPKLSETEKRYLPQDNHLMKIFPVFLVLRRLVEPTRWEEIRLELRNLVDAYSEANMKFNGFPEDWSNILSAPISR